MHTMKSITSKKILLIEIDYCIQIYKNMGLDHCVTCIHENLLMSKIRFPLLELAARNLYNEIDKKEHVRFLNAIASLNTIGGNVLIGIILQLRSDAYFNESFLKAFTYISEAKLWYVSDIIGERLFGVSLLKNTGKTISCFKMLIKKRMDMWFIRSFGAGSHYAIKKGLEENHVHRLFSTLLEFKKCREKPIQQGIGWAAKTTAKFHPDIIKSYNHEIYHNITAGWFQRKVKTGLERNLYVKRNSRQIGTE